MAAVEKKFHDVQVVDTVVATGGSVEDSINHIAQDVTENTRVGRKIIVTDIAARGFVRLNSQTSGNGAGEVLRGILFLDTQANGATATVTDVLASASFRSFYNLANINRFVILWDKTWTFNPTAAVSLDGAASFAWSEHQKSVVHNMTGLNIPIEFNATANTGAMATIRSNNMGYLAISESGISLLDIHFRLRFTD